MQSRDSNNSCCFILIALLIMTVALSGCAGFYKKTSLYKNPNSNTSIRIKGHDSLKKSSYGRIDQSWYIYSNESCSLEEGYGEVGNLLIFGSNSFSSKLLPSFIMPKGTEEIKTSLKPDERVYINVVTHTASAGSSYTSCRNFISFIPYKNTEYIIKQYYSVNANNKLYCGIEVIDGNTKMVPVSFLTHKMC